MARARKPKAGRTRLTPEQKKARRQIRAALRAEGASNVAGGRSGDDAIGRQVATPERTPQREEQFWARTRDRLAAMKIINDHRERPYWMSIPQRLGLVIADYFPCSTFTRDGRTYYGFLFRIHRDRFFEKMRPKGARKEITE